MGDMLDKIVTPLRTPSQASIQDDAISEEVFEKGKSSSPLARTASRTSGKPLVQSEAWKKLQIYLR
jgi:hypothetical protein